MMQNADGTVMSHAAVDSFAITEGLERMRAILGEACTWTEARFGTAGNAAAGAGEEIAGRIVDGMRDEISGSANALLSSAHTLADQMLSGLKNRLGVQALSRVMREEVGRAGGYGVLSGRSGEAVQQTFPAAMMGSAAGLLRVGAPGRSSMGAVSSASAAASADAGRIRSVSGNTFIFQKPVETPYRHAQAIRQTMEEILYGG